jgi:hypothetical protein
MEHSKLEPQYLNYEEHVELRRHSSQHISVWVSKETLLKETENFNRTQHNRTDFNRNHIYIYIYIYIYICSVDTTKKNISFKNQIYFLPSPLQMPKPSSKFTYILLRGHSFLKYVSNKVNEVLLFALT